MGSVLTALLENGAQLLIPNFVSKSFNDGGKEPPWNFRFLTKSNSTGDNNCSDWSEEGSCLISETFICWRSSCISSLGGKRAQTGDGFANDSRKGRTSFGASFLALSPYWRMDHSIIFLTSGACVAREATSNVSELLCGLQYLLLK